VQLGIYLLDRHRDSQSVPQSFSKLVVGWLANWLVGLLFVCLVGWLAGWLVGWI
jgi:hypothetical protein